MELSIAMVLYKAVPPLDHRERGIRSGEMMAKFIKVDPKPTQAIEQPPLLQDILFHNTNSESMLPLVREARRLEWENPRILGVNVPVSHQCSDVPHMEPIFVVSSGHPELERTEAKRLAHMMWEHRRVMKLDLLNAAETGKHTVSELKMPVVLVEMGDHIGDESVGDSTAIREYLPNQDAHGYVSVMFDPKPLGTGIGRLRRLTGQFPTALQCV